MVGCKKIDRWRSSNPWSAFFLILSNCVWHLQTDIILLNNFEKKKKRMVPQIYCSVYVNSTFENRYTYPDSKKSTQWFVYWNSEWFFLFLFLFFQHAPFSSYLLNSIFLVSALSVSYALHISKLSRLKFPWATLLSWNYRAICIMDLYYISNEKCE